MEKPAGELKLEFSIVVFLMHGGQEDESVEVAEEEADMVIKAVIFVISQARADSLIGQYI